MEWSQELENTEFKNQNVIRNVILDNGKSPS